MKSLKNHFSFIIPLFVLLFSYQFAHTLSSVVDSYEKNISANYSMVLVALKNIDEPYVRSKVPDILSMKEVDAKEVISKFKNDLSSVNMKLLKTMLPKFYIVKLSFFPKENQIKEIETQLLKIRYVTKVETFSKSHTEIYRIMSLARSLVTIFTFFVFIVSFLLLFKQVEVWTYAHRERVEIMELFGAPFWMKSAILYKLVVVDSFVCVVIVSGIFMSFLSGSQMMSLSTDMGFVLPQFSFMPDAIILLSISLTVSLASVSYVMMSKKSEH